MVEGTTLHIYKLSLVAGREQDGVFAAVLHLGGHAASFGIELVPLGFTPPPGIASLERWDVTAAVLDAIRRDRSPS